MERPSIFVSFVLPGRGVSGGVRVTARMAAELERRGLSVRILYRRSKARGLAAWRSLVGWVLRRVAGGAGKDWLSQYSSGLSAPFTSLGDVSFRPGEVVIGVGSAVAPELRRLTARVVRIRYCHGIPEECEELLDAAWRFPMRTVCVSPLLVDRLRELTGEENIEVIPNGVDPQEYFPLSGQRDGVGAIYHSSFAKGGEYVIDVMRRLALEELNVVRLAFGMERRPRGLKVHVYKRLPSVPTARQLYNRCKVWFVASRREGFGLPILEAMACGCAVVSSDNIGSRTIIRNGENGLLVPIGDTAAMVAAIRRALADDGLRARLVQAGFETVKQYSWDRAADLMEQFLRRLVDGATDGAAAVSALRAERATEAPTAP